MGMQGLRKAKGLNHMRQGFDNDKYIALQAEHIRSRINQFGGKLYLEFGGKLFDDYHASRVLPGFEPDSKFRMLKTMVDEVEIIIAINANHIEKSKTRGDLGITYDEEVLRLLDVFRSRGFATSGVVITHFENQPSAVAFRSRPYSKPCSDFIAKGLCGSASQLMAKAVNNSKICNHFSVFVS